MQYRDNYKYAYIADAATTQVDIGQGQLIRIIVGETAAGAISIIDNTTGSTVNIGTLKASIVEGTYDFNVQYALGLRIITAGASKITVVYNPI
jgi:hypothetical protein